MNLNFMYLSPISLYNGNIEKNMFELLTMKSI